MGSSETNGYNIDSTEGGLVWVRRRNGSWWPGRILCPDELSGSCLVSPRRSGTPVKLLGREDASVDWYNLEKSKRVKAFRCGEFDECIEKARVSTTISCKKAVKYARREDAILQALELENFQLSKSHNPETSTQADKNENVSDKFSCLDSISISPQELSRTATSADDSEDDGTKGSMKRMRGLEDLGIGREVSLFKKKRSRVVHIHDFLRKKNRRCQLTKVVKRTAMVTVPVTCEERTRLNGDDKVSHSMDSVMDDDDDNAHNCKQKDDENSTSLELLESDDSSRRLFDVPFIQEEKHIAGSSPGFVPKTGRVGAGTQSVQSSIVETVSVEPDEFQEFCSISSGVDINHMLDNGTSKWQNKGKRKSRNKNKTKTMQKNFNPDDKSRKVNMVDLTAAQRMMPIRQSLYDVDIEVKVDRFTQHLPYISLLSNFTGQQVTGHSLEVEVLNNTVSDFSLNTSECLSSSCELGGVSKVNEDVEMVPGPSKKPKKNGLLSNKKIRSLSSLSSSKRPNKTGTVIRPDLACIPLKVVFGRIYAALGISSADAVCTW